jgi:uncharacterized Zn-binding protein involved in type VI secretion
MPQAARITDIHACGLHPPGIVVTGSLNVNTGYQPAARVGDIISCGSMIVRGSVNVFINFKQAARVNDPTSHPGRIALGCPNVFIGESTQGTTLLNAAKAGTAFAEDCPLKRQPPTAEPNESEG